MKQNKLVLLLFIINLFVFLSAPFAKDIIVIPNDLLKRKLKAAVIFPSRYHQTTGKYPVIYLLHGYGGNHLTWPKIVPLKKYADSLNVFFVCPDGNFDSWYIDSPIKSDSKYETYIIKNVIPFIDNNYRVIQGSEGRAICGSSMGGHGALTLLCRHPDLFCAATSISGILDLTQFHRNWNIKNTLGEMHENKHIWLQHSFLGTMALLCKSKKPLLIDCGLSDFALETNRIAHRKLDSIEIRHEYNENPGNHSHTYVQSVFKNHLVFLTNNLKPAH